MADAQLRFSLSYLFEASKWKLVGINVRIVEPETAAGTKSGEKKKGE
jgi:hypothetical protein